MGRMHNSSPYEMPYERVRFALDPTLIENLDMRTAEFGIIGQDRALRGLRMATSLRSKGYNVFVTGPPGTGRRTAVTRALKEAARSPVGLRDVVYVNNFAVEDQPKVLYLPAGTAHGFRDEILQLTNSARYLAGSAFERSSFKERRDKLLLETEGNEQQMLFNFEGRLNEEGFKIVQVDDSDAENTDIAPLHNNEVSNFEELQQLVAAGELPESTYKSLREKYFRFTDEMRRIFAELRANRDALDRYLENLKVESVKPELDREIEVLRGKYTDERVHRFLDELGADILGHISWFAGSDDTENVEQQIRLRYEVNTLVTHTETDTAPIVFERDPDFSRLIGFIDNLPDGAGESRSHFTMIRAGSLIRASGGFLVLRAEDILQQETAWAALKRVLQDQQVEIRSPSGPFPSAPPGIRPEPVDVDVKVVVIAGDGVYDALYNMDDDFQKLFKVPAEFDSMMPLSAEAVQKYVSFLRMVIEDEQLLPVDHSGVEAIAAYGVRLTELRDRISTRFSLIADLLRESSYWARESDSEVVDRLGVERALAERRELYRLPEEKIDEQIVSGELMMSVDGSAVGRINGLAVIDRGFYAFGRPLLITARVAPGSDGIVNVERESGLSGEIHDKGVYIIEGFLQERYARSFPLSIRASICFEQNYVEVDGDSASSSEVYVLLSAITGIPLRQDIAVTGSVNQMGEIQPVGGISEKIEGFYEVCKLLGVTGRQGVVIPALNENSLILNAEVQEAVHQGTFHIYSVRTVDEGMEILTGLHAGVPKPDGSFAPHTLNGRVEQRLREMALVVKKYEG